MSDIIISAVEYDEYKRLKHDFDIMLTSKMEDYVFANKIGYLLAIGFMGGCIGALIAVMIMRVI